MTIPTGNINDALFMRVLRATVTSEICAHRPWDNDGRLLDRLTFSPMTPDDQEGTPVVPIVFRKPPLVRLAFPRTDAGRELILDHGISKDALDRFCVHLNKTAPSQATEVPLFMAATSEIEENVIRVLADTHSAGQVVAGAGSLELVPENVAHRDTFIKAIVQIVMRALLLHPDVEQGLKVCLGASRDGMIRCDHHVQYIEHQLSISLGLSFSLP